MNHCPTNCPAGLDSWTSHGNLSPLVAQVQQHHTAHLSFLNPLWQCRLHMNYKIRASWLHMNQVNIIFKIFTTVQLPGTHTYRCIAGKWQPSKTFIWLLILPSKSLRDRAIWWVSDQAPLSHSSCQFTFQNSNSVPNVPAIYNHDNKGLN